MNIRRLLFLPLAAALSLTCGSCRTNADEREDIAKALGDPAPLPPSAPRNPAPGGF